MQKNKKFLSIFLSASLIFSTPILAPENLQRNIIADIITNSNMSESLVTDFSYAFSYTTPGYADGTIRINATEDGIYKIFWGDANGNKLTKNGYEYSYLARVVVKDGAGSYNIISDYTAIPKDAQTVLVYKKDSLQYVWEIPAEKLFVPTSQSYTFGALSDLHYGRYSSVYDDDAVPAVDNALMFLSNAGIDFVGVTGDLTSGGEQTSLDKYNAALAKQPDMTVLSCIGNHDSRVTLSTSSTSTLDTAITRWYNSLNKNYFTVDEDGSINNNLIGHEILATNALTEPITTYYRPSKGADGVETTVPGLDFVTESNGNIFVFFNAISKTGTTYDTDKLITTGQMDWLEEQLETYKDKNVFLFFHSFLGVNTLNNDAVDYDNCTGDLKNDGGYSYDLDFKDVVTTTDGLNMQSLLSKYGNVTMFSGHSHWQYSMQEHNANLNIGRLSNGEGATLFHLSSVTSSRYIGKTDSARTDLNGYSSEGTTVTVYDDCIVYNCIDFYNNQYEAYATYIVPVGDNSQYQPIDAPDYEVSSDAITGDEYLEAEDMTTLQLLKSNYNLMLGAGYVYSSKGTENTDGALTDGSSTGSYLNTKEGKSTEQYVIVTLDGVQKVSNLKNFMLYFTGGSTDSSSFNIQLSLDGENYETVGNYSGMTYKTTTLDIDTSNLSLTTYKYIKLNLTGGTKTYGYQIREFAAIGNEKNQTPNTAGSSSSLVEGVIDEEDYLDSDYNLIYAADYTQTSTGNEDKTGALTDGSLSGYVNTERSSSAKSQEFVIDMGKANIQNVSNINYFLLYSQNTMTNVTSFDVSISLDGENYEVVGNYSNVDFATNHFDANLLNTTLEKFRYVKLTLNDGNTTYGYQIKEFAVIGVNPIEYPEIGDQTLLVSSGKRNLALNKTIYVSSTYANEGTDSTVLTDGKKDGYWSSDWNSTLDAEYIVIDLGSYYRADNIDSILVNFKSKSTFCEDYRIEFANTYNEENIQEGFYEVARTKAVSWDILQKYSDSNGYVVTPITDVTSDEIRYVKINMNGHKNYGFQIYEVAVIAKELDISNSAEIQLVAGDTYTCTGKEITPALTLKYNGNYLIQNTDFTVSYSNNTNPGTATITITGIGIYTGKIIKQFTIINNTPETEQPTTTVPITQKPTSETPTTEKVTTQAPTTVKTKAPTTVKTKAPGKAKISKVYNKKKSSSKVKISIRKVQKAYGYEIVILKTSKSKKYLVKKTSKKLKVTVKSKKLKKQKKLYVKVRAYNLDSNGNKIFGKWSKAKKVRITK